MAFSADEVRVLRHALAEVLNPGRGTGAPATLVAPRAAGDDPGVLEHLARLRLADALEDAVREAGRMRAFERAELARYRRALPGAASGYLERLTAAVAAGHVPGPDDLAALRRLRALPCGGPEYLRRTALLRRCETLAEIDVRQRLEAHMRSDRRLLALPLGPAAAGKPGEEPAGTPRPKPAPKPGAKPADKPSDRPADRPADKPSDRPADRPKPGPAKPAPQRPGGPGQPEPAEPGRRPEQPEQPGRRTPTPAEIWPPHRRRRPDEARSA
jgi:hypothetical protein